MGAIDAGSTAAKLERMVGVDVPLAAVITESPCAEALTFALGCGYRVCVGNDGLRLALPGSQLPYVGEADGITAPEALAAGLLDLVVPDAEQALEAAVAGVTRSRRRVATGTPAWGTAAESADRAEASGLVRDSMAGGIAAAGSNRGKGFLARTLGASLI